MSISLIDGHNDSETYRATCPFCGKEHEQRVWLNIICDCGAKYYGSKFNNQTQGWLNRATGEWRY